MIRKYSEIFCWKNVSSFCSAKATHIFSAKNIRILCIWSAKTVNEMTLNDVVKLTTLWTTGPRISSRYLNAVSVSPFIKYKSVRPSFHPISSLTPSISACFYNAVVLILFFGSSPLEHANRKHWDKICFHLWIELCSSLAIASSDALVQTHIAVHDVA